MANYTHTHIVRERERVKTPFFLVLFYHHIQILCLMEMMYSEARIRTTTFPSYWNNKHSLYKQVACKRYITWFVSDKWRQLQHNTWKISCCLLLQPLIWGSPSALNSLIKPHNLHAAGSALSSAVLILYRWVDSGIELCAPNSSLPVWN